MTKNPPQCTPIPSDHALEHALRPVVEAALLGYRLMAKQASTHHRGQRERHGGGDENRHRERNRKLTEQSSYDVSHKKQRNENGYEGDGEGDDGEADLIGALERGFERPISLFKIAGDVFNHHDRIVDDEAGGDRKSHQSKVVEA